MRKYVLGIALVGLFSVSQWAAAAGAVSGYLGVWIVKTYVDTAGVTHSLIRMVVDESKPTYIDKLGVEQPLVTRYDPDNECTLHTEAYIDLDDPSYAQVKREWYALILVAETMKRPIAFNTSGCVKISPDGVSSAPKIYQVFIR